MNVTELMLSRKTCKAYDVNKKIPSDVIDDLLNALRLSPSSGNLQPWHFVVTESEEGKELISKSASDFNTLRIKNASHVLVFCVNETFDDVDILNVLEKEKADGRIPDSMNIDALSVQMADFMERFSGGETHSFLARQLYLALGVLLVSAALKGVDATPMEGFDRVSLNHSLKLKEKGFKSVLLVSLGYSSDENYNNALGKSRRDMDEIFSYL